MNSDTAEQADVRRASVARTWWLGGLAFVGLYFALLLMGGEAADLAGAGVEVLPFVALALLAYAGTRSRPARLGAWAVLALLTLGAAALAVGQVVDAAPGERDRTTAAVFGVTAGLIVGWACVLRRVRAAIGRALPIEPDSFVHMVALIAVISLTLVMLVPLIVQGEPPLLLQLERDGAPETDPSLLDDLYGLFWLVPAAVVAVGFPLVRGWRPALARLGLVRPTILQVAFGIAASVALVITIAAIDQAIARVWEAFGWAETDTETFDELIAYALNPLGALVIGVTAGLGEELAMRGVLQPRLGILLPNLFFAALHALQYNFDGLLSVFLVGLVLGLIRRRTNTPTSAIVHGAYNFWLIMLSVVAT